MIYTQLHHRGAHRGSLLIRPRWCWFLFLFLFFLYKFRGGDELYIKKYRLRSHPVFYHIRWYVAYWYMPSFCWCGSHLSRSHINGSPCCFVWVRDAVNVILIRHFFFFFFPLWNPWRVNKKNTHTPRSITGGVVQALGSSSGQGLTGPPELIWFRGVNGLVFNLNVFYAYTWQKKLVARMTSFPIFNAFRYIHTQLTKKTCTHGAWPHFYPFSTRFAYRKLYWKTCSYTTTTAVRVVHMGMIRVVCSRITYTWYVWCEYE